MPHLGKPYPYPIHRDVMNWAYAPSSRLAKSYTLQYRISGYAGGTCEFTARTQASLPVEYIYEDVICRWRWEQPCPSGHYFFLERIAGNKLEDFAWRWSSWDPSGLLNRTVVIAQANPDSHPNVPATIQWGPIGPASRIPIILANPTPTPW